MIPETAPAVTPLTPANQRIVLGGLKPAPDTGAPQREPMKMFALDLTHPIVEPSFPIGNSTQSSPNSVPWLTPTSVPMMCV